MLQNAKKQGCKLLTGGGKQPGSSKGFYIAPTIFKDVPLDSQLWTEEVSHHRLQNPVQILNLRTIS